MLQLIISWSFYILFFFVPLFFSPATNELFEFNKMFLTYGLTIVIVSGWVSRMISEKKLIFRRTPLGIFLFIFYITQVLSTFFSIDPHTSYWGYPSRLNGGLLSITSYLLLYFAFVSNFEKAKVTNFVKAGILGGFFVALYAIPEHFGSSPSCLILTGHLTDSCWVQDVQARVFATLGQPNWLAAYLAMLIFPCIYFVLESEKRYQRFFYYFVIFCLYLAFTFTYSRGAMIGFVVAALLFVAVLGVKKFRDRSVNLFEFKPVFYIFGGFLVINLLFASALTSFRLIQESAPPPRPALVSSGTQLENGGTESGQIRLIVWKGAVEVFKHYPIFGSGLETFAYSYYFYRPGEHNLVSEWDFLYNKAHNEYLNYLATTGILGFVSYLVMIGVFLFISLKKIVLEKNTRVNIIGLGLICGYVSFLIQNFFQFSVVVIATLFYLFPALFFVLEGFNNKELSINRLSFFSVPFGYIARKKILNQTAIVFTWIICLILLFNLAILWVADTIYKKGLEYSDSGNPGKAYNYLLSATSLNRSEPLYQSELSYAAATAAVALKDQDATRSAQLRDEAISDIQQVLAEHPKNVSFFRTAVRTYYALSDLDPMFTQKAVESLDSAIVLSPTDPKLYYNKGLILGQENKLEEGVAALKRAIELKPNYKEGHYTLGLFYEELKQYDKALDEMQTTLKFDPQDQAVLQKIDELKEKK